MQTPEPRSVHPAPAVAGLLPRSLIALSGCIVACSSLASGPCCGGARVPAGGTSTAAPVKTASRRSFCEACSTPSVAGALVNPEIREASGLTASLLHPDVFYTHNDSGDSPRFFAIDHRGSDLGTFEVAGAAAIDWEDVARGPCANPGESCLYLADIGDNHRRRSEYAIYRVLEPATLGPGRHQVTAEALPFTYPDGSRSAETLLIHPVTGVLTIVTKATKTHAGTASIFEFPLPLTPGRTVMLMKAGDIRIPIESARITGGAVHPQAKGVLLRTHTNVLFYPMSPGQSAAQALASEPCVFPPDAAKGEGITWLNSGAGFVTSSEGAGAAIRDVSCPP